MIFISRCLRTKDVRHPFDKRCKNSASVNSVLCKDCLAEAKSKPIHILMHNDVTKQFGVKFRNQLTVRIHLNGSKPKKPDSNTAALQKIRKIKLRLHNQLMLMKNKEVNRIHDKLGLNIWRVKKSGSPTYAIKYQVCQAIISKFVELSDG